MNAGVIASRYARALLKFAQESGTCDKVYDQACVLVLRLEAVPQLRECMTMYDELSSEKRIGLLCAALGEPMEEALRKFCSLVILHHRMCFLKRMLASYIWQYRKENNIMVGRITVASPADSLKERMENLFHQKTGTKVNIKVTVNPDIIGGFIFELDDLRLDASVSSQLRKIEQQLVEKNNRIV